MVNVNSSDIWVAIAGDADYEATLDSIKDTVGEVPGMTAEVVPFSTQDMRDVEADGHQYRDRQRAGRPDGPEHPGCRPHLRRGTPVLAAEAAKVQQLMSTIDGVVNPRVEGAPTQPTIEIEVDLDKAQQLGITPGAVRRAEATLLQGIQVGSVFEDQKVFDVIVLERLPREAACRLCSRCSSIGQAAAISGWATLPRSGSRRRRRSFTVRLFRDTWTSSLILTVEASEQSWRTWSSSLRP